MINKIFKFLYQLIIILNPFEIILNRFENDK
jgi:hypothetical protein